MLSLRGFADQKKSAGKKMALLASSGSIVVGDNRRMQIGRVD